MISFHQLGTSFVIKDKRKISAWIKSIIQKHNKKTGDISIVCCSKEEILNTNITHLNHHYHTDIITFDYCEEDIVSGDLMICPDVIFENAIDHKQTKIDELHRVIIHGTLHLIGFGDKTETEQETMTKQENESLALRKF